MKKTTKILSYLSLISIFLFIIFAGLHLFHGNEIYQEIMKYSAIPFATIFIYMILVLALFGFQLGEKTQSLKEKILGNLMIVLVTMVMIPIITLLLDKGFGFLDPEVFYQVRESGRLSINTNARVLTFCIAGAFLFFNLIFSKRDFIKKLPLFNEA